MLLQCQRCGKRWTYGGEQKFYASCPDCKSSVKIKGESDPLKHRGETSYSKPKLTRTKTGFKVTK